MALEVGAIVPASSSTSSPAVAASGERVPLAVGEVFRDKLPEPVVAKEEAGAEAEGGGDGDDDDGRPPTASEETTLAELAAIGAADGAGVRASAHLDGRGTSPQEELSVHVANLDDEATPEEIYENFVICGEVQRITIKVDRYTGARLGFAYIDFADEPSVLNALSLDGSQFREAQIKVSRKRKHVPNGPWGKGFKGGGGMKGMKKGFLKGGGFKGKGWYAGPGPSGFDPYGGHDPYGGYMPWFDGPGGGWGKGGKWGPY